MRNLVEGVVRVRDEPRASAAGHHRRTFALTDPRSPALCLEVTGRSAYIGGVDKNLFDRWQANFWAGLAIVLPGVISIAVLIWLFGTVANITDTLLIFLPRKITHHNEGQGAMYWYWSLVALALAIFLVG